MRYYIVIDDTDNAAGAGQNQSTGPRRASWPHCWRRPPATLLILRATDVLTPGHGIHAATQIAIALYVIYNIAATITSFSAGGLSDTLSHHGPLLVTAAGVMADPPLMRCEFTRSGKQDQGVGHCCIKATGVLATAQASRARSTNPMKNRDKPGI